MSYFLRICGLIAVGFFTSSWSLMVMAARAQEVWFTAMPNMGYGDAMEIVAFAMGVGAILGLISYFSRLVFSVNS